MTDISFRSARDEDALALLEILNPYIIDTVISFTYEPHTEQEMVEKLHDARNANMPFIVAVNSSDTILGYVTAGEFRTKRGYLHTVEITLFCRPKYTGQKIGSRLVELFLAVCRDPTGYREYLPNADDFTPVRQVIAGMAVDIEGPRQGLALKEFYEKCGFVQTGWLPNIGYKFDRWIDVIFMQLSLW